MTNDRNSQIIKTSIVSIAVNIMMVLIKMVIGLMSNSIAIILDAVNNFSDAMSAIITIIGTKLAGRKPDKKHPYGYGRIEYLTSVLISVIILIAGLTSLKESAVKVIHPEPATYSAATLIIIVIAIVIKFLSSRYIKGVGEKIHSQSLIGAGSEAFFDCILSAATFLAAIINILTKISLEGILGLVISAIIVKAGMELLLETLNSIIGIRTDKELSQSLKAKIRTYEGVKGAYDLALHNYGPMEIMGSVHIEVDDHMTAKEIHRLTRHIIEDIFREYGIVLTVGIYASNTTGSFGVVQEEVRNIVANYPDVLQMHGFYYDEERKEILFDMVADFHADANELRKKICAEIEKKYPGFTCSINNDTDYSD